MEYAGLGDRGGLLDSDEYKSLYKVNSELWKIEDGIRALDDMHVFDDRFVELARSVYKTNDHRSYLKMMIDKKYKCFIGEIKTYVEDGHGNHNGK